MTKTPKIHKRRLPLTHIIKVGGSTFDAGRYKGEHSILPNLADVVINLFCQGHILIVTCGAGPNADGLKSDKEAYDLSPNTYSQGAADAVKNNCLLFADILRQTALKKGLDDDIVSFHETSKTVITSGHVTGQVSVVPFASDFVMGFYFNTRFNRAESDVHTLLIGEGIGHYLLKHNYARDMRVTFVKDTNAIYMFDPNRTDLDQSTNQRLPIITVEDFIRTIDRHSYDPTPLGQRLTGNHLLEESAAILFKDKCTVLNGIRIIKHTPQQNLASAVRYGKGGSLIVNKYHKLHPKG